MAKVASYGKNRHHRRLIIMQEITSIHKNVFMDYYNKTSIFLFIRLYFDAERT